MEAGEGRERLRRLSARLVALHAALLARERVSYEATYGPTDAAGLLRHVLEHEHFAWLRSLSRLIARIDEAVDAREPATGADAGKLLAEVDRLLRSGGTDVFATRYREALQESPEVVMAHAEVVRVLGASRPARPPSA